MKICIYGAGAIGGYLGAKLTEIGADVTLIARGPHYEAIRQDGLRLRKDGKELVVYPRCVDTAEKAGKLLQCCLHFELKHLRIHQNCH